MSKTMANPRTGRRISYAAEFIRFIDLRTGKEVKHDFPQDDARESGQHTVHIAFASDGLTAHLSRADGHAVFPRYAPGILSKRVVQIAYRHEYNDAYYQHPFDPGVSLIVGSRNALLERPDGKEIGKPHAPDRD
jgi:hypothetical protein